MAKRKKLARAEPGKCRFCRLNLRDLDYKDIQSLSKLISSHGKMFSRKRSGNCAYHQRAARRAIKRARFMALLPYV